MQLLGINRDDLAHNQFPMCLFLCTAIFFFVQAPAAVLAVPACPQGVDLNQPDGTPITIFLHGDEFVHWHEDNQGYLITKEDRGGRWVYCRGVNGATVATAHAVGKANPSVLGAARPDIEKLRSVGSTTKSARLAASAGAELLASKKTGTMKNLVVLVNFSDLAVAYPTASYDSLFNQVGYTTDGAVGSVKDYYNQVSYNQLAVESTVVEPVTLANGYAYYGANTGSGGDDKRPREMVSQALALLEARGFDFRTVDGDGDGWVDGLTIIHAGGGEEYSGNDADYIWSHQWSISTVTYDGVRMSTYHTEPARRGWDSTPSGQGITRIGVICHENAHFLGLPDLYDYGHDSEGAGNFCLMAGGSWNGNYGTSPAHMSAWCKASMGWLTPTPILNSGSFSLPRVEDNATVYKLQNTFAATQYFLVENRQGYGFDAGLPGPSRGILIWHVDETIGNNNDQTHYKVDLEEASGTQHLEQNSNAGQDSDYFRSGTMTSFSNTTTPNTNSYSGQSIGISIDNISASDDTMTFYLNGISMPVDITSSAGPNGTVSPAGTISRSTGSSQIYTATPDTGYAVDQWTLDGSVVQDGGTTYTLSNIQSAHTVTVSFKVQQFTIDSSAGANGSVLPSGSIVKDFGDSQTFTATPDTGYAVDQWTLDGRVVQTGGSVYAMNNIQASHSISVTFKILQYTITASAGSGGSINPSDVITKLIGENQSFTATPDAGYIVDAWLLDGNIVQTGGSDYTVVDIHADCTVQVTFKLLTFPITASAGQHGAISPSGSFSCGYGETLNFSAVPDAGYTVDSWYVNGGFVKAGSWRLSVGPVDSDCNVTVTFRVASDVIYVDHANADGPWDGTTLHPFKTVQAGTDAAGRGGRVIIAPGTYTEYIEVVGHGVAMESTDVNDAAIVEQTIIDGGVDLSLTDANCTVAGLSISNGAAAISAPAGHHFTLYHCILQNNEAGLNIFGATADIQRCDISHNKVGIHFDLMTNTSVRDCNISDNIQTGLYVWASDPCIYNCTFNNNNTGLACYDTPSATIDLCEIKASIEQGVFCGNGTKPLFKNCTIESSSTDGILCYQGAVKLENCIIASNGGCGISLAEAATLPCEITNCTITENSVYGVSVWPGSEPVKVINSIVWGNGWDSLSCEDYSNIEATYSDIQNSWPGVGNINSDPLFGGQYREKSQYGRYDPNSKTWVTDAVTSPCIDAGDANSTWNLELWPHGKRVNMGAFGNTRQASMSPSSAGLIADLDFDGDVDDMDLGIMLDKWLGGDCLEPANLDRQGTINVADFGIFAASYGANDSAMGE